MRLQCPCGASANDTSKERKRFLRRHMANCMVPRKIARAKEQATVNNVIMDDDVQDTPNLKIRSRS